MIQRGVTVPAFRDRSLLICNPGRCPTWSGTQFGYHILKVEEKQTAHQKPLDEVKAQILATLTRQQEADQQAGHGPTVGYGSSEVRPGQDR